MGWNVGSWWHYVLFHIDISVPTTMERLHQSLVGSFALLTELHDLLEEVNVVLFVGAIDSIVGAPVDGTDSGFPWDSLGFVGGMDSRGQSCFFWRG